MYVRMYVCDLFQENRSVLVTRLPRTFRRPSACFAFMGSKHAFLLFFRQNLPPSFRHLPPDSELNTWFFGFRGCGLLPHELPQTFRHFPPNGELTLVLRLPRLGLLLGGVGPRGP